METKNMERKEESQSMPGLRKFISPKAAHRFANLTSFLARFIIIFMFLIATALAQVQSHRLSEIRIIDQDLNLNVYSLNATMINATDDICITGGVCLSNAFGTFYDKTTSPITANFGLYAPSGETGYDAGTAICNSNFTGTHMCSFTEIVYTISTRNFAAISGWNGEAWIASGPAKYSPAALPVADCNGFTHGTAGSHLGNWWTFSTTTGGVGRTGHCGNTFPIACCK
ncbi:MAG: hypothetical protein ABIA62_03385 [Candidatus Woesearchaeota archaeon]